ncbi:hypothetical protein MTO96_048530 [Rhipicephalus appendiculatus]
MSIAAHFLRRCRKRAGIACGGRQAEVDHDDPLLRAPIPPIEGVRRKLCDAVFLCPPTMGGPFFGVTFSSHRDVRRTQA